MINFDKITENTIITELMPYLANTQTYLVGGFLRDFFLGKESCDIDFVVPKGEARALAIKMAERMDAHFVALDEVNNIYRVVMSDKVTYVDIADCECKDIFEDLKRRDFTINSLGFDLNNKKLIDITGALEDLENGVICEISEKNIIDDPLRILRAFRFQSELDFEISPNLKGLIKKHAPLLAQSAKERVNTELVKLFAGKNAHSSLFCLDETGILQMLFPEINEIKKVPSNSHHHLCLFEHSIETVRQTELYYENAPCEVKEHFESLDLGAQKRLGYLKIAAFLHDLGKPSTWQIEPETGRQRFIKHDDVGSKLAVEPLRNLKFSKKQIKYIQKLIKYHIYPANVVTTEEVTDKAVTRFFRKTGNEVLDIIAIAHADRLSAQGPEITQEMTDKNINGLHFLMKRYIETKNEIEPIPKLLDGNEIMDILNINPGPKLGKIVKELYEAQMSGDVLTKEQAINYIKCLKI